MTTVAAPLVLLQVEGRIARLTLNRPDKGNAFDVGLAVAFDEAVAALAARPEVRVVIISGAGKRFCVGGDIESFAANADHLQDVIRKILDHVGVAMARLASLPLVTITAVNGAAGGAGIGLALSGDIVVAAESVKMGAGYSAIGLSPDAGASWYVTRRVGVNRALELFLTNRPIAAAELCQWGAVNRVVPDAELAATVDGLAQTIANGAHGATLAIKELAGSAASKTLGEQLARETELMLGNAAGADAREGVRAFLEKRKPRYA